MLQKLVQAMTIIVCVQVYMFYLSYKFLLINNAYWFEAIWHELELIGIKNTKSGQFQTDFRIKRIGKLQSMEGTFVFVGDYNDDFDVNR